MKAVKVDSIYVTTDYSLFKKLPGNRDVTPERKNKILNSMKEFGILCSPIKVNEKMETLESEVASKKTSIENIRPQYENFRTWAEEYDKCTVE